MPTDPEIKIGDDRINRPSSIMENWCRRWSNRVSAQCKTQLLTFMINTISINTALPLSAPKSSSLNLRRVYCHWIVSYFGGWGNLQLHYHLSRAGKKGLEALYTSRRLQRLLYHKAQHEASPRRIKADHLPSSSNAPQSSYWYRDNREIEHVHAVFDHLH